MRNNPIDPVIDSTSFHRGIGGSESDNSSRPRQREATVGATNSELGTISEAIDELQGRLALAHEQLAQAAIEDTSEYEISRVLAEIQRFSEGCLSKLEIQIRGILFEVDIKAAEILREAEEEAAEILRRAQQASSFIP
jgi:hypothetical protein